MDALGEDVRLLGKHFATLARFEEAMQSKVSSQPARYQPAAV